MTVKVERLQLGKHAREHIAALAAISEAGMNAVSESMGAHLEARESAIALSRKSGNNTTSEERAASQGPAR